MFFLKYTLLILTRLTFKSTAYHELRHFQVWCLSRASLFRGSAGSPCLLSCLSTVWSYNCWKNHLRDRSLHLQPLPYPMITWLSFVSFTTGFQWVQLTENTNWHRKSQIRDVSLNDCSDLPTGESEVSSGHMVFCFVTVVLSDRTASPKCGQWAKTTHMPREHLED